MKLVWKLDTTGQNSDLLEGGTWMLLDLSPMKPGNLTKNGNTTGDDFEAGAPANSSCFRCTMYMYMYILR